MSPSILSRALAAWLLLLAVAIINGGLRPALITPRIGDTAGRAVSTIMLGALIMIIALLTIRWIAPRTRSDALMVGITWIVLTFAFEFLAGHYLFASPWQTLLEDYDLSAGRI